MADTWTIKRCLDWTRSYLEDKGDERPRLSAEWLLTSVTGLTRTQLYMNFDQPLEPAELDAMHAAVVRRAKGEPLQYIAGETTFRTIDVACEPGVLIPRPETELLVEEVLAFLDREVLGRGGVAPARERIELPWNAEVEQARKAEAEAAAAEAARAEATAAADGSLAAGADAEAAAAGDRPGEDGPSDSGGGEPARAAHAAAAARRVVRDAAAIRSPYSFGATSSAMPAPAAPVVPAAGGAPQPAPARAVPAAGAGSRAGSPYVFGSVGPSAGAGAGASERVSGVRDAGAAPSPDTDGAAGDPEGRRGAPAAAVSAASPTGPRAGAGDPPEDVASSAGSPGSGSAGPAASPAGAGGPAAALTAPRHARVLEVGCGTGCISLSIAHERAGRVACVATDIEPRAVALAARNRDALGIDAETVDIRLGDLVQPLDREREWGTFDVLVSNPPYIPHAVMADLPREVAAFEPALALDGGADGLDIFRRLVRAAPHMLRPGGLLACELFEGHLDEAAEICRAAGFVDVRVVNDLTDRPRMVLACMPD